MYAISVDLLMYPWQALSELPLGSQVFELLKHCHLLFCRALLRLPSSYQRQSARKSPLVELPSWAHQIAW